MLYEYDFNEHVRALIDYNWMLCVEVFNVLLEQEQNDDSFVDINW